MALIGLHLILLLQNRFTCWWINYLIFFLNFQSQFSSYEVASLNKHNQLRAKHGVPALTLNKQVLDPVLEKSWGLVKPAESQARCARPHTQQTGTLSRKEIDFPRYNMKCSGGKRDTARNISCSIMFSSTFHVI